MNKRIKVKIFEALSCEKLQNNINQYIEYCKIEEIVDIKYIDIKSQYSAMIILKEEYF